MMKTKNTARLLAVFGLLLASPALQAADHLIHVGGFAGVTVDSAHTSPTLGLDVELSPPLFPFGLIAIADFATGSGNHAVYAGGLTVHPTDELRLVGAVGVESAAGHSAFLVRVGANYDLFDLGPLTLGPAASIDFVSGHKFYVLGIVAGIGL
jgi:hypothetical protein